jgi:hypothetical protein
MTDRIRWEPAEHGGWIGYAGTLKPFIFQIHEACAWKVPDLIDGLALASTLPGDLGHYVRGTDPDRLKAEAERWLEEFASSLGAIFPEGECPECGFRPPTHTHDKNCSRAAEPAKGAAQ